MNLKRGDEVKLKPEVKWMYSSEIRDKIMRAAKKDDGVRVWLTEVGPVQLEHLILVKKK